jgi:hypothetical protein
MRERSTSNGVGKALADPTARKARVSGGSQTCRTLTFIAGSFRLELTFVKEGSILDLYYEIWE